MKQAHTLTRALGVLLLSIAFLVACVDESENVEQNPVPVVDPDAEGLSGQIVKFEGEIFSIPSPVQTAILIKNSGIEYNEELLNDVDNTDRYINQFQKAMNMGVYGADLAYLSNFNNISMSIDYFNAIDGLADDLGIRNNIDAGILIRFNKNIEISDSLYSLNAELYREANRYLLDNERNDAASLILAGGWIEALHISIDAAATDDQIRNRVGEQRSALQSLVSLMGKFDDVQVQNVRDGLAELVIVYQEMETSYTYVKPITDDDSRTTYLNSKTEVSISDEHLARIKTQVEGIRNTIIG
jgi:hypothetical protein